MQSVNNQIHHHDLGHTGKINVLRGNEGPTGRTQHHQIRVLFFQCTPHILSLKWAIKATKIASRLQIYGGSLLHSSLSCQLCHPWRRVYFAHRGLFLARLLHIQHQASLILSGQTGGFFFLFHGLVQGLIAELGPDPDFSVFRLLDGHPLQTPTHR